jgi:hypothetical protein
MKGNTVVVVAVIIIILAILGVGKIRSTFIMSIAQPTTHITINVVPLKDAYRQGETIMVRGYLSCSGQCPLAVIPYTDMDIELTSSWGWSDTVQTDGTGQYTTGVVPPSDMGSFWIKAEFKDFGDVTGSSATFSSSVIPEFSYAPVVLLSALAASLYILRKDRCVE